MEQAIVLLNQKQAAKILTVKEKTLEAWRTRGGGPRFKRIGRLIRYTPNDLQEFVRSSTRASTSDRGAGPS